MRRSAPAASHFLLHCLLSAHAFDQHMWSNISTMPANALPPASPGSAAGRSTSELASGTKQQTSADRSGSSDKLQNQNRLSIWFQHL